MEIGKKLFTQRKEDKDKIYSVHEPQVEYIAKGKAHKKCEFSVKVGLATTSDGNWVTGIKTFAGNPYDGHTLTETLEQVEETSGTSPKMAVCDLGYRGHDYKGDCDIQIVNKFRRKIDKRLLRYWKRRSAIEPII